MYNDNEDTYIKERGRKMYSLEQKKEMVIMQYQLSYDLDIAMVKVDLTEDEKALLKRDKSFLYRIEYQDAMIKEKIVTTMLDNLDTPDPRISQKAAIDLGNLLWKERFKGSDDNKRQIVPDTIILEGDRKSTRLNSSHIPLSRMPSSA